MSVARSLLSPSQPIWAEHWDGRVASGKCQRPIGLDEVARWGTVLDVQWSVVQSGCAWHRVVLAWALGLCLLGAKGKGCDVLRMHLAGGPDGLGEARGTVPGWRDGGLVKVKESRMHILPWGGTTPGTSYKLVYKLGAAQLESSLPERPEVCWWTSSWTQAISVPLWWSKQPLELHCQQDEERVLPLHWALGGHSWSGGFSSSSEQGMGIQEGPQEHLDVGAQAASWDCSALRRLRGTMCKCWMGGMETGSESAEWCPETEQGTTGISS